MDFSDLTNRFKYHAPNDFKKSRHQEVRRLCYELAQMFNSELPEGREQSLAVTKLEEAMMWANAAIARNE